jgi:methylated-DNA-[protein]-cysteine S-methyltransferase
MTVVWLGLSSTRRSAGSGENQNKWLERVVARDMTRRQLRSAIELGGGVETGKVGPVELDQRCREEGGKEVTEKRGEKRKLGVDDGEPKVKNANSAYKRVKSILHQSTLPFKPSSDKAPQLPLLPASINNKPKYLPPNHIQTLHKISIHPTLTPYRKRLYIALLSVPSGRYTAYKELSAYLSSSARAVGNGMCNNPFAPEVPCHRVLAADGSVGGFMGDWGKDGRHAGKKIELLRSEGVKFDARGRVVGQPFRAFHNFNGV